MTQRYDNSRSGLNLRETTLNIANVNSKSFGRLFSRDVDGEIYAQPLIVTGVNIPGKGKRDVVFVATEHNSVYAFDAKDPAADQPYWHAQMGPTIPSTDVGSACGVYKDFSAEIGITGTPVIDPVTQTLYVVARTKVGSGPASAAAVAPGSLKGEAEPDAAPDAGPDPAAGAAPGGVPEAQASVPQASVPQASVPQASVPQASVPQAQVSTIASSQGDGVVTAATPAMPLASLNLDGSAPARLAPPLQAPPSSFHQYLHAIDIRTGKERPGSPVEIKASVPGNGAGSVHGTLAFDPLVHNQRPGLLLHNGVVYICWGGHCDTGPYHGWIIGYDAKSLHRTGAFCTTPNGLGAGIWQSGVGPIVDQQGHLCFVNGNGTVDTDGNKPVKTEYGSSFMKLQTVNGKITVADWFTPYNFTSLNDADLDTGSTSFVTVPGTSLMVAGSKAGMMYVLNGAKLGGFNMFDDQQIVQKFSASKGFLYSTPVLWEKSDGKPWLYSWGMDDRLKAYELDGTQFNTTPVSMSSEKITSARPGGFLSLSANGRDPSTAILWALQPVKDANQAVVQGTLHAFNANDLSQELWSSRTELARDDVGLYAKFCPPIVANGRVYVASFSNQLHVYGLNPPQQAALPAVRSRSFEVRDFVTLDTDQPLATIHYTMDGSNPTSRSTLYRTPFLAEHAGMLKARAFVPNQLPSPMVSSWIGDPGVVGEGNGLLGHYFATVDLSGDPVQRVDPVVRDNRRPAGIGETNWSGRWTGEVQAPLSGTFTFSTISDDGVRLWVGGKLLIDDWNVHGAKQDDARIELVGGQKYPLLLEYYQGIAGQTCQLLWTTPGEQIAPIPQSQLYADVDLGAVGTGDGLAGSYFNNGALQGAPVGRKDGSIVDNVPPDGVGPNNWSVRWSGEIQATETGTFTLSTVSDDGVRLWVGDQLLVNDWPNHAPREDAGKIDMVAGQKYPIILEYHQVTDQATCQLLWTTPSGLQMPVPQSQLYSDAPPPVLGTGQGLTGNYYANTRLGGEPVTRIDAQIVDALRPPDEIPEFNWSARWTGQIQATQSGTYTLSTITDDGARLWIDGKQVINDWNVHGATENRATVQWAAGEKHAVRFEYFQGVNAAACQLLWTTPTEARAVIPQSQLYAEVGE